jgi:hypothetical protein
VGIKGGLLAGVATAALGGLEGFGGFIAPGLCSIEDGSGDAGAGAGGGGAGGGAAVVEDEDFFAGTGGDGAGGGAGDGAGGGDGAGAGDGAGGGDQGGGEAKPIAEWMKSFSAEKADGELSNQEWLAKTGVPDLDTLVKRARDTERAFRESGKVKIPGENATEAELKTYREAVGAPDKPEGYELALPEGAKDVELDASFVDPFKAIALKHNIPKAAFAELGAVFMQAQYGSMVEEAARHNADKAAKVKEWGPEAETRKEEFRRGLSALGLKVADVSAIQNGYGAGPTLELFAKIGQLAGEDFFSGNGGRPADRFGVANAADAQKAIDAMIGDPEMAKKIRARDPVVSARYNRLTDALAHFRQMEAKR